MQVMAMEAESESIGMLASTDKLLDNEFARLEGGSGERPVWLCPRRRHTCG